MVTPGPSLGISVNLYSVGFYLQTPRLGRHITGESQDSLGSHPALKAVLALLSVVGAPAWRPGGQLSQAQGVWPQHPKLLLQACPVSPGCYPHASGNQRGSTLHVESLVWPPRETKPSSAALWPQHALLSWEARAWKGPRHINSSHSECTMLPGMLAS